MKQNFPFTTTNVADNNKAFGPNISKLRGKPVQHQPITTPTEYVKRIQCTLDLKNMVMIKTGVVFVNLLPFLSSSYSNTILNMLKYMSQHMENILVKPFKKYLHL